MNESGSGRLAALARIRVEPTLAHELALCEAVRHSHLVRGPHLRLLAERLTSAFGKSYAVLTANGFSALLVALQARCLAPGTSVRTAAAGTCFAMVNAIRGAGLATEFTDLEPESLSLALPGEISEIAIAPDCFGRIAAVARAYRTDHRSFLVEDAAQAFFSRQRVPTQADAVVLSFYPTKWMDGIDGGAVLTDDAALYERMRRLVSYVDQVEHEPGVRFNLAMPNLHASYALVSFEQSEAVIRRLLAAYKPMARAAIDCGLTPLQYQGGEVPTRFIVRASTRDHRDRLLKWFAINGIEASQELQWLCPPQETFRFPGAAQMVDCTLSLPFHPHLRDAEIERVVRALQQSGDV